jgi:cystathionine beta-lyase/cystathionine gamma-synthase
MIRMVKQMKKNLKRLSAATLAIHGSKLYAFKGSVATPIYQTSTFRLESSEDAVRYAKGDPSVYVYSRYHNPTIHDVEEKIALMEHGEMAALFSSGMAAITTAILAVTKAGDNIISTSALYGGTYRWMRDELPKQNITVHFVDAHHLEDIVQIADKRTTIVYIETPTNPTLSIVDISEAVRCTKKAEKKLGHRILTIIDNTFATFLNQDPFQFGVDVITESATKYLGGHSDILSGIVIGKEEYIRQVYTLRKYHGGCADPFAAYLLGRSLKTFELRVKKQTENALILARVLEKNKKVNRVLYPGLLSHPLYAVAKKQMTGFGGIVTIEVKPSKRYSPVEAAAKVCDNLTIAVNAMSLGSVETLVSIPVYSSHVFMSDEELQRQGVTAGMIRISVGVEGIEDLITDFEKALAVI